MAFDNRLIIDCFANVVNILIWQFFTNDIFKSEKCESIMGQYYGEMLAETGSFDVLFWNWVLGIGYWGIYIYT